MNGQTRQQNQSPAKINIDMRLRIFKLVHELCMILLFFPQNSGANQKYLRHIGDVSCLRFCYIDSDENDILDLHINAYYENHNIPSQKHATTFQEFNILILQLS